MLAWCRRYARAICRISVAELRQVAPPVFSFLMIISLLLADNLHLVFASRYRTEVSSHISSNLGHRTNGDDSGYGVLYSRSGSSDNININFRNQAKGRTKLFISKRGDSTMNGETQVGNSKLMKSHLHLQLSSHEVDTIGGEEKGMKVDRKSQAGIRENDHRELSLQRDTISANSGLSSSLPSSDSSQKSSSPVTDYLLSLSLTSTSLFASNSSNNIELLGYSSGRNSCTHHNDKDINTCPDIQQFFQSPQEVLNSILYSSQCLTLDINLTKTVCHRCEIEDRINVFTKTRLSFCSSYNAASVSCASSLEGGADCPLNESSSCQDYLEKIIIVDNSVKKKYEGFEGLIDRYDCNTSYSVKWQCHHCKQAYKDWLCSQDINFFRSGKIVLPCMEFCSNVEEMCPFFRPKLESYAGDHSFICKDPHMNLPSSTPERDCYGLCDLWPQQAISQFYCSHADNQGTHCPLLKKCSSPSQNETLSVGNHNNTSNNSTSGVNILNTISRTPTFSFSVLHIFCLLFAMLLRFPLALTEWHHLSKGLT